MHINKKKIIGINRKLHVKTEYLPMDTNWQYAEEGRW
jgi:hypothetical protein